MVANYLKRMFQMSLWPSIFVHPIQLDLSLQYAQCARSFLEPAHSRAPIPDCHSAATSFRSVPQDGEMLLRVANVGRPNAQFRRAWLAEFPERGSS